MTERRLGKAPVSGSSPASDHRYSNAFRVGYNQAEFVIEFSQAYENQASLSEPIRVVTAPAYAKALGVLILETVAEYEARHGTIPVAPAEF